MRKIGIDIDGVLADFYWPFFKWVKANTDVKVDVHRIDRYQISEMLDISEKDAMKLVLDYSDTVDIGQLPVIKGAVEAIDVLAKGHELYIVTARQIEAVGQTFKWLDMHFGLEKFERVIFTRYMQDDSHVPKTWYFNQLGIDIVIEDHPNNIVAAATDGYKALLFNQTWNQEVDHEDVIRCFSWEEVLLNVIPDL